MLDSEPTGDEASAPSPSDDSTSPPAKATRRRRTTKATAAPPEADNPQASGGAEPGTGAAEGASTATAPAKRTRRRAAAAPAADGAELAAPVEPADAPGQEPAPAKKATRARKATKATKAAEAPTGDAAEAPAPRTRRRATKAVAVAPDQAPDPDLVPPAAAVPPPPGGTAEPTAAAATNHAAGTAADPTAGPAGSDAAPGEEAGSGRRSRSRRSTRAAATPPPAAPTEAAAEENAEAAPAAETTRGRKTAPAPLALTFMAPVAPAVPTTPPAAAPAPAPVEEPAAEAEDDAEDGEETAAGRRRRRGRRGRGRGKNGENGEAAEGGEEPAEDTPAEPAAEAAEGDGEDGEDGGGSRRRRRRRRRTAGGDGEDTGTDDPPNTVTHVREARPARERRPSSDDEVQGVRGSTRLEAKRQRRRDGRDAGRRRPPILSEAEFLARREAVDRVMVVRQRGDRTQIAVLEDDVLVEHYVTKASSASYAGNVYLGRVQNVLPSMEAAFVDIGKARNAVLYAGEVNWDITGLEGKARSIEHALKPGDPILVQVTKDPIGHKGARLTSQISLPGRYLVYVPNGSMTGISRKLPDTERSRLKDILRRIVPEDAGVIIRTAAEGASEEELTRDVKRLHAQWEVIRDKSRKSSHPPLLLSEEPDLAIRVVRDVFNEDFSKLVVSGDEAWETLDHYVNHVAPDLAPRLSRHGTDSDVFADLRIDEQLMKALDRKVWLPSGGSLVIDRTEAMTVIDVNTGKFTGQGGTLEQTVTRNNLEAAEEIVRQLRLRDIGGIIVIDFIDMVLESNRDLVLRRLTECLGRDRTKHQVAEVTSLGLVQMTRKRVGQGLLEAFSEPCPTCGGRGLLVHSEPLDDNRKRAAGAQPAPAGSGRSGRRRGKDAPETPAELPAAEEKADKPEPAKADKPDPARTDGETAASAEPAQPTGRRRRGRASRAATNLAAEPADTQPAATAGTATAGTATAGTAAAGTEAAEAAAAEAAAEADEAAQAAEVAEEAAEVATTAAADAAEAAAEAGAAADAPDTTARTAATGGTAETAATAAAGAAASESNGTASRVTGRIGAAAAEEPAAPATEHAGTEHAEADRAEAGQAEAGQAGAEPEVTAEPAPRRRRRAASRPPGPPAAVGAEGARNAG
jgi:ribonuclease E